MAYIVTNNMGYIDLIAFNTLIWIGFIIILCGGKPQTGFKFIGKVFIALIPAVAGTFIYFILHFLWPSCPGGGFF